MSKFKRLIIDKPYLDACCIRLSSIAESLVYSILSNFDTNRTNSQAQIATENQPSTMGAIVKNSLFPTKIRQSDGEILR